jgi:hypothetical protein
MNDLAAYFPARYPGELWYSLVARYLRHVGNGRSLDPLKSLFGQGHVESCIDWPCKLSSLIDRLPCSVSMDAHELVRDSTLLPYFTAFVPAQVRAQSIEAVVSGAVDGLHFRLGISAFRVKTSAALRFCPACLEDMLHDYGEAYWLRDHQLASVLVCARHEAPLHNCSLGLAEAFRHQFIAASKAVCPSRAQRTVQVPSRRVLEALLRIATTSTSLAESPPEARSPVGWAEHYRDDLANVGLARSANKIDQVALHDAFRLHHRALSAAFPMLLPVDEAPGDWLADLVRDRRKVRHPLMHLLLQDFLAARVQSSPRQPFGRGPWPCLNPLAAHQISLPVSSFQCHSNKGRTVGVFSCECGYVYTRNASRDGAVIGQPRFQRFGPLLKGALSKRVSQGQGLRAIARDLGLDPKTVVALAEQLHIQTAWSARPRSTAKRRKQGKRAQSRDAKARAAAKPRRDWLEIDGRCNRKVAAIEKEIRAANPPVRVSAAEIDRRLGARDWLSKRQDKLPLTMSAWRRAVEPVPAFQERRVYWAIGELARMGVPLKPWRITRLAGLGGGHLRRVMQVLDRADVGGGNE